VARGHGVLLPEIVIWEWAAHADDALDEIRFAATKAKRAVDPVLEIGLATCPEIAVVEIFERISGAVAEIDGITVVATDPAAAAAAIVQQVTQVGTGSRSKDGTKTGAADALVVSVVAECLDDGYDEVVVASGDKLLGDAARGLDERVVVVRDHHQLWAWHGLTPPPTAALAESIASFAGEQTTQALASGHGFKLFDEGASVDGEIFEYAGFETEDVRETDVVIEAIDEVRVDEVEIVEGDEVPRVVVAELRIAGVALVTNWFVGGNDGELLDEWSSVDVIVSVPVTVELDEDWRPLDFDVNDKADVLLRN
jgi:hypothetical protein